jgi:DNA-binding HxlR family transcriptional regulator
MESKRTDADKTRLPIHRRVADPPPMQLTRRDRQVIHTVYKHRFLRRDQIQTLLFPSQNTANRRLQHLFQHGFLKRHLPPVRLGEGRQQAIYALDERGADLIAAENGLAREEVRWRKKDNRASFLFLDHTLHINDFRIAITLAVKKRGHQAQRWLDERDVKAMGERVPVPGKQKRYLPVTPDAFFEVDFGDRKAGFFLEMDMGTMANKRFKNKVRAYIIYKTKGYYEKKFGITSLRVLTVTTSQRRLRNLKRATESAKGQSLFWFTTFEALSSEQITQSVWEIAGRERTLRLF